MSTKVGNTHERTSRSGERVWTGLRGRMGRPAPTGRHVALLVLLAIMLAFASPMAAGRDDGKKSFTVFTQNAYVGVDLLPVMWATQNPDPSALVDAVTTAYYDMLASRPDVRMAGLADRIAARTPDIVALQEMYLLRKQSPGDLVVGGNDPAEEVVADFLQSLMHSLAAKGLHYRVAAMTTELDVEMPMFNEDFTGIDDARLTDRDVILVRTDLPRDQFRVSNAGGGNFTNSVPLSESVNILQGWCAVDVFVRGERFRLVNTHLQDESVPWIRYLQAQELLAQDGPADTNLPVMMVGDFNADPNLLNEPDPDVPPTYPSLIAGGFDDAWSQLYPHKRGLTWGHDPSLSDPSVRFVWRIDLILFNGHTFVPKGMETVDAGLRRHVAPFWPSDHAGVWASFELK
jgi:endonuclease/exonuclease/phosphatase family metal-dependent hydrolase